MMSLKRRFLVLNMMSVFAAVLLTALLTVLFAWFYFAFHGSSSVGMMSAKNMPVLLFKNDNLIYTNSSFEKIDIIKLLESTQTDNSAYLQNGITYQISTEKFVFEDGTIGKIVRLIPNSGQTSFYLTLIGFVLLIFFLLFLTANMIVVKYFRKAIIRPVEDLTEAAQTLSDGEMNFVISEQGQDEVRELCLALEQLRIKLKETLYLQNKYDENRKFLLSTISHDLKTPVTSIKGYIDGVLDGIANTPEKINQYLNTAAEKTIQLNVMIDDLLFYSKLDMEQIPYHFTMVDLCEYLRECTATDQLIYAKESKKIHFDCEQIQKCYVNIDTEQFRRVHQNIVDNARKHIESHMGDVTISIRERAASVIIEYKDNGIGIKEDDLPHIFDRFYRGDTSRKTDGSSGLGLAIAKHIVEGHGGRIWAVSKEEQGTSILISLKKAYGG